MSEQPPNLHKVACCGMCIYSRGWLDNMFCDLFSSKQNDDDFIQVQPFQVCDRFDAGSAGRAELAAATEAKG
jgi:hypothetical protein